MVVEWWPLGAEACRKVFGTAGGHAGVDETAAVVALAPELVEPERMEAALSYKVRSGLIARPAPGPILHFDDDEGDPVFDDAKAKKRTPLIDRWILSELALTTQQVTEHMDAYRVYEATGVLTDFVDALSNWYVRRNRDRFWAPGLEQDKLDVHWTLYECLVTTAKLVAPFLPFAAEDIWQNPTFVGGVVNGGPTAHSEW